MVRNFLFILSASKFVVILAYVPTKKPDLYTTPFLLFKQRAGQVAPGFPILTFSPRSLQTRVR
jgi:hypothetical protein